MRNTGPMEELDFADYEDETDARLSLDNIKALSKAKKIIIQSKEENVTSVDISRLKINDLTILDGFTDIELLYCYKTEIFDLTPVSYLKRLTFFNCSHTPVAELGPLKGHAKLSHLYCYNTSISDITPLVDCKNLESLNISGNRILNFPTEILKNQKLNEIIAFGSRIDTVPSEELSASYSDNCLDRLKSYYIDLDSDGQTLNRLKIIIIGNGQVGKSQIRRWIVSGCPEFSVFDSGEPSTHGIIVENGALILDNDSVYDDGAIETNVWDFGGQDIYHGTHALFVNTRAIFVVCWNTEQEYSKSQELDGCVFYNRPLEYWLNYVKELSGRDNPVVIVQTNCERDDQDKDLSDLISGYDENFDFLEFCQFSAVTARGGHHLRNLICRSSEQIAMNHGIPVVGRGRLKVLNTIEEGRNLCGGIADPIMSREEFDIICEAAGGIISSEHLLEFFHNSGVIFYRQEFFEDHLILNLNWAFSAIYAVFNRGGIYQQISRTNGRFYRDQLSSGVWSKYTEGDQALFLKLMESCGIIFVLYQGNGNQLDAIYVAPELLPDRANVKDRIEAVWRGSADCEASLTYNFLHEGVIRNVIARVGGYAGLTGEYWRHGVLFFERNTKSLAIIEASYDENHRGGALRISCREGYAKELMGRLVSEIRDISCRLGLFPEVKTSVTEALRLAKRANEVELDIGPRVRTCPSWYVSYAWGDDVSAEGRAREQKVASLCDEANNRGIDLKRDVKAVTNGDSIRLFMDQLVQGDRVIVILSDKYLRSRNCMFELYQSWNLRNRGRDNSFVSSIRVYVMPDTRIYDMEDRSDIANYWDSQIERLNSIRSSLAVKDIEMLNSIQHMYIDIGDILCTIAETYVTQEWSEFLEYAFMLE